jgi:hypothetical protein|tara:strand:+ start:5231 stop:6517 length:1287 start_codon:yes stop_codon:yes gene_type:complete
MHKRTITKKALNTEDCLELAAGISELKYSPDPELSKLQNFHLHEDNANIMFSIAKQVFRGTALTAKQYSLVKKLLTEYYVDQFSAHEIDLHEAVEKLRFPLREIDSSHWIKFVEYKGEKMIAIRFPFNKKVIKYIEELKNKTDKDYFYDKHTHYFPLKEKYIWKLVEVASKFDKQFDIDESILDIHKQLKVFDDNPQDYVPGIYKFNFQNYPQSGIDICLDELGQPNYKNIFQYYDRRHYYGINHFDLDAVAESIKDKSELTKKIVNRASSLVCVNSTTWPLEELVKSIDEMNRYPLMIMVSPKDSYGEVTKMHNLLRNFIDTKQMAVLFRLDSKIGNDAIQFNQYVKAQGLNNSVDKNTKVVYISNNKIPKPILKIQGWKPKGIFTLGSNKFSHNIESFVSSQNLIIQYDADASPHYSYGTVKAEII